MSRKVDVLGMSSLFVSVVTGAVNGVILCRPLYVFAIDWFDLPSQVILSKAQILKNYDVLICFLYSLWENTLRLPNFSSSAQGVSHFKEVRVFFLLALILFLLSIFPTIFYLKKLTSEKSWWVLARPMKFSSLFSGLFVLLLATNFDSFFELFHQIFFRNEDWIFYPTKDPIILILPEGYFFWCFLLFFFLVEACFFFFWWKGRRRVN